MTSRLITDTSAPRHHLLPLLQWQPPPPHHHRRPHCATTVVDHHHRIVQPFLLLPFFHFFPNSEECFRWSCSPKAATPPKSITIQQTRESCHRACSRTGSTEWDSSSPYNSPKPLRRACYWKGPLAWGFSSFLAQKWENQRAYSPGETTCRDSKAILALPESRRKGCSRWRQDLRGWRGFQSWAGCCWSRHYSSQCRARGGRRGFQAPEWFHWWARCQRGQGSGGAARCRTREGSGQS